MSQNSPVRAEWFKGLLEWLTSERRSNVPGEYLIVTDLLERLVLERRFSGATWEPGDKEAEENKLREALVDGVIPAWLLPDAGVEMIDLNKEKWSNWVVWHRALHGSEPEYDDADFDGEGDPKQEWKNLMRRWAPGRYLVRRADVLRWLGLASENAPQQGTLDAAKPPTSHQLLLGALSRHLGFDQEPATWVPEGVLKSEIEAIFKRHGLEKFNHDINRLAKELRGETKAKRGRPRGDKTDKAVDWATDCKKKRDSFVFETREAE